LGCWFDKNSGELDEISSLAKLLLVAIDKNYDSRCKNAGFGKCGGVGGAAVLGPIVANRLYFEIITEGTFYVPE
jgi:hypothetical protein